MKKLFNLRSKSNYDICIIALSWSHYRLDEFVILPSGKVKEKEHTSIREKEILATIFQNKTQLQYLHSWSLTVINISTLLMQAVAPLFLQVSLSSNLLPQRPEKHTHRLQVICNALNTFFFFIPSDVDLQT